ncbi:hypothetical protein BJX70DRAFT_57368 [Aspergillus crustosus]
MPLLDLPNELLLCIANHFEYTWDINALCRVNRDLYAVFNPFLGRRWMSGPHRYDLLERAVQAGDESILKQELDRFAASSDPYQYMWTSAVEAAAEAGQMMVI